MKIEELKIESIKPYEKNPRKNDAAVDGVAESIKQFGFQQPIVIDSKGVIIAGHTRYKAAQKLGLKTVPCVRAEQLTKEQVKAYRILDNKLAEKSTWDFAELNGELQTFDFNFSLFDTDISSFCFTEDDIKETSVSNLNENNRAIGAVSVNNEQKFGIFIELDSEEEQLELYNRLTKEGYNVRTTSI